MAFLGASEPARIGILVALVKGEEVYGQKEHCQAGLNDTGRNKGFAKRTAKGQFKEIDDVGRSLAADRRRSSKTAVKSGHGDQGNRPRAAVKKR